MQAGVYSIVNTANGKLYIGSTKGFKRRLYEHRRQLRTGTHRNKHLQSAWKEYGERAFSFRPIAIVRDTQEMLDLEREMIVRMRSFDREHGYNISIEPSNNQLGLKRSAETRARIGAAMHGNKNRLGAVVPQEMRERIAAKLRGKPLNWPEETKRRVAEMRRIAASNKSPAWRAKTSAALRGRVITQDVRDRIAATLKARHAAKVMENAA